MIRPALNVIRYGRTKNALTQNVTQVGMEILRKYGQKVTKTF